MNPIISPAALSRCRCRALCLLLILAGACLWLSAPVAAATGNTAATAPPTTAAQVMPAAPPSASTPVQPSTPPSAVEPATPASPSHALSQAVEAYDQGRYADAAVGFLALVEAGFANGELYYNLGNTYLKSDDLGRAILWYERARRWLPRDPDLAFNLEYARSQRKDMHEAEDTGLLRVLCFPGSFFAQGTLQLALVVANLVFWAGLLVLRRKAWRPLRALTLDRVRRASRDCPVPGAARALGTWPRGDRTLRPARRHARGRGGAARRACPRALWKRKNRLGPGRKRWPDLKSTSDVSETIIGGIFLSSTVMLRFSMRRR